MIVHVKTADYLENYKLHLTFNTGESGEVDLEDIVFKYSAAAPLRNIEDFKAFELDEWSTICLELWFWCVSRNFVRTSDSKTDWFAEWLGKTSAYYSLKKPSEYFQQEKYVTHEKI